MKNNELQNSFLNVLLKFFFNEKYNFDNLIKSKLWFTFLLSFFSICSINAPFNTQNYLAPRPWQYFTNANGIVIATNSSTNVSVAIKRCNGAVVTILNTIKGTPAIYSSTGLLTSLTHHPTHTIINGAGLIIIAQETISVNIRNVTSDQLGVRTDGNIIYGNASLTSFGTA